jgi:hypothetical protein
MKRNRNFIGIKQYNGGKTSRDTMPMGYYGETERENFTPRYLVKK